MYILATSNKGKLEEFKSLFSSIGLEIESMEKYEIGQIEENGKTFEENSLIKAKTVSQITKLPTIADDSGLCIEDLDGKPGVHTARMFEDCVDYTEKCKKMINLVNEKNGNRRAKFVCVISIYYPDGTYYTFKGEAKGIILKELKGENGHGYDPIFYSDELKKSFAQASIEEKNDVSHRAKAFKQLKEFLIKK